MDWSVDNNCCSCFFASNSVKRHIRQSSTKLLFRFQQKLKSHKYDHWPIKALLELTFYINGCKTTRATIVVNTLVYVFRVETLENSKNCKIVEKSQGKNRVIWLNLSQAFVKLKSFDSK